MSKPELSDVGRIQVYGQLRTTQPRRMGKLTGVTAPVEWGKLFQIIFLGMIFIVILALGLAVYESVETAIHCGQWENKIVHQQAWTQFIYTGKVMIPIYHPAGDYYKNVCVEPK